MSRINYYYILSCTRDLQNAIHERKKKATEMHTKEEKKLTRMTRQHFIYECLTLNIGIIQICTKDTVSLYSDIQLAYK